MYKGVEPIREKEVENAEEWVWKICYMTFESETLREDWKNARNSIPS